MDYISATLAVQSLAKKLPIRYLVSDYLFICNWREKGGARVACYTLIFGPVLQSNKGEVDIVLHGMYYNY